MTAEEGMVFRPIATIYTDFQEKFGIPRQSGLAKTQGRIVFCREFSRPEAVRGLEGFSHLWLIWYFSQTAKEGFSPTVRPPRLGGNKRMGVFATRSPFRPNAIGLSSVELLRVETQPEVTLYVSGADLLSGTPILDIKPYLPFTDCHPDASGGFAEEVGDHALEVELPPALAARLPGEKREALISLLENDPRPSYQEEGRVYGFGFAGREIKFTVQNGTLTVLDIL